MTNGHDQPDDGKDGEYPDATYLYIRTNPADDGTEPLAPGLAFWQSPDIVIVQPGGATGGEAVADAVNTVEVTVTNAGGIIATDAYVDAFFGDPATVMTPLTTIPIGGTYVTVPAIGTATVGFPWTPSSADAGHRCLLARVSLVIPPDTYANPSVFDVPGDRHVAQRNIHVLALAPSMSSISFSFVIANPSGEHEGAFLIRAAEVTPDLAPRLGGVLGCAVPPRFADGTLGAVRVRVDRRGLGRRPTLQEAPPMLTGVLRRPLRAGEEGPSDARLAPGARGRATVTIVRNPDARAGEISAVDVQQLDAATEQVLGGLTLVVRYA
jgi:hypothetical protein